MTIESVGRTILWRCLSLKRLPGEFNSLFQQLHVNSRSVVYAYSGVSSEFIEGKCIRRGWNFSFHFFTNTDAGIVLSSCENRGTDILSNRKFLDLEHADDDALLSENPSKLLAFLDLLNNILCKLAMRFAPLKSEMLRLVLSKKNWVK